MLLPLTGGDPALGPATFTRMVLPFAYHLRMLRRQRRETDRICWTACEPEQHEPVTMAERLRYFTPETAEVLHGGRMIRARLPEISEDARGKLDLGDEPLDWWRGGKRCPMRVRMGAPHILLFETKAGNIQSPSALQMGLLVLEFSFHREVDWDAILAFNEAFRMFRQPFVGHKRAPLDKLVAPWLPPEVADDLPREGERAYLAPWLSLLALPLVKNNGEVHELMRPGWLQRAYDNDIASVIAPNALVLPDNRAFVWTAVVGPAGALALHSQRPHLTRGWTNLVNVDQPSSARNAEVSGFDKDWAQAHSYLRWSPRTLYGFTQHSGVALVPNWTEPPVWQHFRTLYFDQACLLLYLRSAIFALSAQISGISRDMVQRNVVGDAAFRRLEHDFSVFTNLYQFPLLSHQQQGVELYEAQRKALDIDDFYDEVGKEIQHMAEMYDREHDRKIRTVGILIAVAAILGTVMGDMGVLEYITAKDAAEVHGAIAAELALIVALLAWCAWRLRK